MGLITRMLGLGQAAEDIGGAVENVAEVFTVNKTKAEMAAYAQSMASLDQYTAEFSNPVQGWFDTFINGVNRLPRPVMAIGTIGLFVYAMAHPEGFADRMRGLAYVPDPLWWLLGAVVSFYFGARELHYSRSPEQPLIQLSPAPHVDLSSKSIIDVSSTEVTDPDYNPALDEWLAINN